MTAVVVSRRLVPILSFSLITGLGLDYDIFLITAITEERWKGYSNDDAISAGLCRSGPIISWAGLIMAVAYGGFLFTDIPLLNQLGMMIVFAVLVDTFVVRPLYVPAAMHIGGAFNFWPMTPPRVSLVLDGAQQETPDVQWNLASPCVSSTSKV